MIKFYKATALLFLSHCLSAGLFAQQQDQKAVEIKSSGKTVETGTVTLTNLTKLVPKEISKEISMPQNGEIHIENTHRHIILKTWNEHTVKITATVLVEESNKETDETLMEKNNLSLKVLGSAVKIKSGSNNTWSDNFNNYYVGPVQNIAVGDDNHGSLKEVVVRGYPYSEKDNTRKLVITVPEKTAIEIESHYGDVTIEDGIPELNLDITNGNAEIGNLKKLVLRSRYGNIEGGDMGTAQIECANGRFSAQKIGNLDIDSKNSTVEMASAAEATIRSTNDEYELEEVGTMSGRKYYGNLRITKLNKSIDLQGANADIKIRRLAPDVSLVKINDRYADVRIPLNNIKNYSVDFKGGYSAVYADFEKVPLTVSNDVQPTITSVGKLTNITSLGQLTNLTVSGTITGGTFSGTLGSGTLNAITTGNNQVVRDTAIGTTRIVTAGTNNLYGYQGTTYRNGTVQPFNVYSISGNLSAIASTDLSPRMFTAKMGDGKGLQIKMNCENCTVDFK